MDRGRGGERGGREREVNRRKCTFIYLYGSVPEYWSERGKDPCEDCKGISLLMNKGERLNPAVERTNVLQSAQVVGNMSQTLG